MFQWLLNFAKDYQRCSDNFQTLRKRSKGFQRWQQVQADLIVWWSFTGLFSRNWIEFEQVVSQAWEICLYMWDWWFGFAGMRLVRNAWELAGTMVIRIMWKDNHVLPCFQFLNCACTGLNFHPDITHQHIHGLELETKVYHGACILCCSLHYHLRFFLSTVAYKNRGLCNHSTTTFY